VRQAGAPGSGAQASDPLVRLFEALGQTRAQRP
jgi:hypothetical protein